MHSVKLSTDARNLLRRRVNGELVEVTPENLEAYRELARAGVMYPLAGFMRGPESVFRFAEDGWNRRMDLQRPAWRLTRSAMLRRILRTFSPIGTSVSGTC
jgi:hypothetical protein